MAIWSKWFRREDAAATTKIAALEAEVNRLTEALPGMYDPDANLPAAGGGSRYFRPLSKSDRDLQPMQHDKAQALSYYLWENNPFAKRIVNLTVDYVLGEGVTVVSKDEDDSLRDAMQKRLDLFWFDPINRMDLKLFDKVRELGIYGEQCWSVHLNPVDGHVRLGYIDPSIIVAVICDPRNMEIPIAVKLRTSPGQPDVYYRIIHVDERPGSASYGRLVGREMIDGQIAEAIYDDTRNAAEPAAITFQGECFYFAVNKVSNAKRGRPDLLAVADWVDGYDQMMFGEVDRALLTKSFVWDVTLTGMDESGVNSYAAKQSPPTPGSVRYHNDKVLWKVESPDLKSADSRILADLIAAYISTGSELPKTWLNATDDVNKASATELGEPAFKFLTARQRQCRYILDQVITFVLDQAELHGALPKRPNEPGVRRPIPWAFACQFPELRPKDLAGLSATFNQSMDALTKARAAMLIDEETAQEVTAMLVGLFGVEVDLDAMRERLEKEQTEKDEQAALMPYGMAELGEPGDEPQTGDDESVMSADRESVFLEHVRHNQKSHGNRRGSGGSSSGGSANGAVSGGGSGGSGGGAATQTKPSASKAAGATPASGGGAPREFTSDAEGKQFLQSEYADWRKGLSSKQDQAMTFYQSPGYELMNGQLRGQKVNAKPADLARARQASKDLSAAIQKAPPLKEATNVYRGFSAGQFGTLKPGATVTDKGFVSTAMTRNQAGSFTARGDQAIARITLPKGTRAAAGTQKEMILPPGSSFRVTGVRKRGKVTEVDMELVM